MKRAAYSVTIDLRKPETHRAIVEIKAVSEDLPALLQFPVWTPGSYLVRDYSRHVTRLEPAEKIAKNKWRLEGNPKSVRYEVYGLERTVRTSYIDDHYAVLVGASLLPLLHASFEVELLLPKNWPLVSSALGFRKAGPGRWKAHVSDDDRWIDCPVIAAAPGYGGTTRFRVRGINHEIAWVGLDCARSMADFRRDFQKIAETTMRMFGGAPFRSYWFLLHFGHKIYGGLEHRDSQLSQFDGSALAEEKDWDGFLRLVAHEYFHAWNVKSLRPRALGPFDYFGENYTEDLWFAEGLTDYFDDMLVWKSGIIAEATYWKARLKDAQLNPDGLPSHSRRALSESSMDAWIRAYKPDEDSVNTDVSYYSKGALLGWCWDALLTSKSKGKWTLAKLMRAIWEEFGIDAYENLKTAKPGYTRTEILAFAEKVTRIPQRRIVESWVTSRKPLPWRVAAKTFKVSFTEKTSDPIYHQSGMALQWKGTQAIVAKVLSGSAAEKAGIAANDELLAVNGTRVCEAEKLNQTWKRISRKPVNLLLARLDRIYETKLVPQACPGVGVEFQVNS